MVVVAVVVVIVLVSVVYVLYEAVCVSDVVLMHGSTCVCVKIVIGKEAKGSVPPAPTHMTHGVFLHTLGRFGSLLSPQELGHSHIRLLLQLLYLFSI